MTGEDEVEAVWMAAPASEGAIFYHQAGGATGAYLSRSEVTLVGRFDPMRFSAAVRALFERHAVLRSAFEWEELDRVVQVVYRQVRPPIELVDLAQLSPGQQVRELEQQQREDHRRGFDPTKPPLLRFRVVRLGEDRHRLVIVFFHGLLDGWSVQLITNELAQLYRDDRALASQPAPSHESYAAWLVGRDTSADEAFWRAHLGGGTPDGDLHYGRRAEASSFATRDSVQLVLSATLSEALRDAARKTRTTLAAWIDLAWGIVLARYGQTSDVIFGVTFAQRPADVPDVEHLVGALFNTVPFRLRIGEDTTVRAALEQVHGALVECASHAFLSPAAIQRASGRPSGRELFETVVRVQNIPVETASRRAGLELEDERLVDPWHYVASLVVEPRAQIVTRLDYDGARFGAALAEATLGHVRHVLEMLLASDRKLGEIELLDEEMRGRVLDRLASRRPHRMPTTPVDTLERAADERPNAVLIEYAGRSSSVAEVEARVNQLAHVLVDRGIGPEHVLAIDGVVAAQPVEMTLLILAAWKAGGGVWVIDPRSPADRMKAVAERLPTASLVGSEEKARALGLTDSTTLAVLLDAARSAPSSRPLRRALPDAIGAVISTSGSTGSPQAVALSHRFIHARLLTGPGEDELEATPGERLSSNPAIFSVLSALDTGHVVVIEPPSATWDPERYARFVRDERIEVLGLSPSHLTTIEPDALPGVRAIVVGGEPIAPGLVERWQGRLKLYQQYLATEISAGTRGLLDATFRDAPSVGRARPGVLLRVLDRSMRLVPPGVEGDVYVGGVGIARGYLGRPDLTATRLVPDPYGEGHGGRLFRTGDRGRLYEDGRLELLGRADSLVKVRGFRVELGEIENVLADAPGVERAAVVQKLHPSRGPSLVAYFEGVAPVDELRAHVRLKLPDYMQPVSYVRMDALPRVESLNVKVLRAALPEPTWTEHADDAAPANDREAVIARVWEELLGVPHVGRSVSFFDLGGHSVLAMQVVAQLRKRLDVDLSVRDLFEAPTVEGLARRLSAKVGESQTLALVPVDRSGELPLAAVQEPFFGIDQNAARWTMMFNLRALVRWSGALDYGALEHAFTALVVRHEALRTSVVRRDGVPHVRVHPPSPIVVPIVDVPAEPGLSRARAIEEEVRPQVLAPFDLAQPPLLRVRLMRASPELHFLLVVTHHAVADGWSLKLIERDVLALYESRLRGKPPELPELSIQPGDFAVWERQVLATEGAADRAYWKALLDDAPREVPLPFDRPSTGAAPMVGSYMYTLDAELTNAVMAKKQSLFALLWGATVTALHGVTGARDLVVGTVHANRDRAELVDVIGCFVNFVALRARLDPDEAMSDLLARFQRETVEAFERVRYPFGDVIDAVGVARRPGRNPLYNVYFDLDAREESGGPARAGDAQLEVIDVPLPEPEARVDLFVSAVVQSSSVRVIFRFDSLRFERSTIERIAVAFRDALVAFTTGGATRLAEYARGRT